jgi:hypothetical protein
MKNLILFLLVLAPAFSQILVGVSGGSPTASNTVATPTYDNATGSYVTTVSVTISDSTSGASITYCTATGSDCSPVGGTSYTIPVVVTVDTTHLCSYATHAGLTDSATKCATYTITTPTAPTYIANSARSGVVTPGDYTANFTVTGGTGHVLWLTMGIANACATFNFTPNSRLGTSASGDSWTLVGSRKTQTYDCVMTWVATNVHGGSTYNVRVVTDGTYSAMALTTLEFTDLSASPIDQTCNGSAASGTTITCSSAMAPTGVQVIVAASTNYYGGATYSVSSPWTIPTGATVSSGAKLSMATQYQIVNPASGTYTPAFTIGGSNDGVIVGGTLKQ